MTQHELFFSSWEISCTVKSTTIVNGEWKQTEKWNIIRKWGDFTTQCFICFIVKYTVKLKYKCTNKCIELDIVCMNLTHSSKSSKFIDVFKYYYNLTLQIHILTFSFIFLYSENKNKK